MKKPFVLLYGKKNMAKIFIAIVLILAVSCLFTKENKAVAVFSQNGNNAPNSLYGMVGGLV